MADLHLEPRSALHGLAAAGRSGRTDGEPGVFLSERTDIGLCYVLAARGLEADLRHAFKGAGFDLPAPSRCSLARDVTLIWTGPGQWLAAGPLCAVGELCGLFRQRFEALCTLVPADDARVVVAISGPEARETLAKLLVIDLHPRAFKPNDAATTMAGAIPAIVWRPDESGYHVAVPRSFAGSFWHWLVDSAAEYGCVTDGAAAPAGAIAASRSDVAAQGGGR